MKRVRSNKDRGERAQKSTDSAAQPPQALAKAKAATAPQNQGTDSGRWAHACSFSWPQAGQRGALGGCGFTQTIQGAVRAVAAFRPPSVVAR